MFLFCSQSASNMAGPLFENGTLHEGASLPPISIFWLHGQQRKGEMLYNNKCPIFWYNKCPIFWYNKCRIFWYNKCPIFWYNKCPYFSTTNALYFGTTNALIFVQQMTYILVQQMPFIFVQQMPYILVQQMPYIVIPHWQSAPRITYYRYISSWKIMIIFYCSCIPFSQNSREYYTLRWRTLMVTVLPWEVISETKHLELAPMWWVRRGYSVSIPVSWSEVLYPVLWPQEDTGLRDKMQAWIQK